MALYLATSGYSFNGLLKVLERSFVWHTVRGVVGHIGLGWAVFVVVCLFAWKGQVALRKRVKR